MYYNIFIGTDNNNNETMLSDGTLFSKRVKKSLVLRNTRVHGRYYYYYYFSHTNIIYIYTKASKASYYVIYTLYNVLLRYVR